MEIQVLECGVERINDLWQLFEMHREELATHKHLMVLKPDVEKYRYLNERGELLKLVLLDGEEIVGYSMTIIGKNLHYSDVVFAYNDVLFLHPDYRKGSWGVKLIKKTEEIAKQMGAQIVCFHGKESTTFTDLMPRLGYAVQDIVFSKEV